MPSRRVRRLFALAVLLGFAAFLLSSSRSLGQIPVPSTDASVISLSGLFPPPSQALSSATCSASPRPLRSPDFCTNVPPRCSAAPACSTPAAPPFTPVAPASVTIDAEGGCFWARLNLLPELSNVSMCTHRPDEMVSKMVHDRGSWLVPEELSAFKQAACTPKRPFMLDVGSNIGSFGVVAAALGCHVISFDPVMANLGRVVESMRRLGALGNATFYQNFVAAAHTHKRVQGENVNNMGGMSFLREEVKVGEAGVAFVVLDELFEWNGRPRSPTTGRPFFPAEVNFLKIDAEGCDLEVLFGAQQLLQRSPVPFLTIEFAGDGNCIHKCSGEAFVRFIYGLGYRFYEPYFLAAQPIPLERAPRGGELWLVHRSAALPRGWANGSST
jgi:FkbM family methyltransferase